MFNSNRHDTHSYTGNLVPGFAFYEGIGNRLAELIVDFVEGMMDLIGRFKI